MKTKKTLLALLIATTMLATGSQVYGQTSGGDGGDVQLPAVQSARDAFYSSLIAYQLAQYEAYFWQSSQGRLHPNASMAAVYWQLSANYQYQSMVRLYSFWMNLEEQGIIFPVLALEAQTNSWYAAKYARGGASMTTGDISGHPAVMAAEDAYDKIPDFPMPRN